MKGCGALEEPIIVITVLLLVEGKGFLEEKKKKK